MSKSDDLYRDFFEAQPQWLAHDHVIYFPGPHEGDEPVLCLGLAAEKAFLRWAVDSGRLPHWRRVERFRNILEGRPDPSD